MYERPDLASALKSLLLPETVPAETEAAEMLGDDWCERPDLACAMVWVSLPETSPAEEEEDGKREMNSLKLNLGLDSSTLPDTHPAEKEKEQREMNS